MTIFGQVEDPHCDVRLEQDDEREDTTVRLYVPSAADTAKLNDTDLGNGERLAAWGRDWLRHVHGVGWHIWDGKRWRRDPSESYVNQLAKFAVRGIYKEQAYLSEQAASATDESEREKWSRAADRAGQHARRSEHASRIAAMIKMARSEASIAVLSEDGRDATERLDAATKLLNVRNGTLDLDTFTVGNHNPADLITKVANAEYDPSAKAPCWDDFLEMVLPDGETRRYVQKAAGYSLLGSYSEYLFIPYGAGQNGKSTFLHALRDVLGDYATSLPAELLSPRQGGLDAGAYSALARMRGARLVTTVETEQGKQLSEALVKELTGEGVLQAKFMRQDMFEYHNKTAVWLATNHLPVVQGTDMAIWRRLRLIPFEVTIPEGRREEPATVHARLRDERAGILRWALEGLRRYRAEGLEMSEPVKFATQDYRRQMDPMSEWLEDCCVLEPDAWTPVADARTSYEEHCRSMGRRFTLSPRTFNEQLRRRHCREQSQEVNGRKTRGWRGISVQLSGEDVLRTIVRNNRNSNFNSL